MSELVNQSPPKTPQQQADNAIAPEIVVPAQPPQQLSGGGDTHYRRIKTHGESKFDWGTYAGLALVGNEFASFGITEATKISDEGKPAIAHHAYKRFESWFAGLADSFKRFEKPGLMKYIGNYVVGDKASKYAGAHSPRLPYLLVATLGGMLMVPFVKYREDHKGEIVRKYDRAYYGARADTDPAIIAAHEEMDNAPKQSWGSLWKGRVTTVLAAATADFAFGWPDALSTKLFKDNKTWQKYGSLERFSDVMAEKTANAAKRMFDLSEKAHRRTMKAAGNGIWLLTLSSSLTALFYISSKLFARRRDQKIEQREHAVTGTHGRDAAEQTAEPATSQQPSTEIHAAAHEKTLAPAGVTLSPSL